MRTIKEIANLAGVSRGTVDRVLHNRGGVNKETELRIKEIVDLSDYMPNKAGKILSVQKKNLKLGMLLLNSTSRNPFISEMIEGAQAKAKEFKDYGVEVLISQSPIGDSKQQAALIDKLIEVGVNGLVIMPENDNLIRNKLLELKKLGIPVITVNTDIADSGRMAYVGSNYLKSGEIAAGLMSMVTEGTASVGIINGNKNILCHQERVQGFTTRIKQSYPKIKIVDIVCNNDDDFISYETTKRLLTKNKDINALFFIAGGVFGGCRAIDDLKLSGKIKIICFDTVSTTKEMMDNRTIHAAIDQDPKGQSSESLQLLFEYIAMGTSLEKEFYYIENKIKIIENL